MRGTEESWTWLHKTWIPLSVAPFLPAVSPKLLQGSVYPEGPSTQRLPPLWHLPHTLGAVSGLFCIKWEPQIFTSGRRREIVKGEENLVYFFMCYRGTAICDRGHVYLQKTALVIKNKFCTQEKN